MGRRAPRFQPLELTVTTLNLSWRCWVFAAWAGGCLNANATVSLRDEVDLIEALQREPPCCVIDARSEIKRRQHAMPDALVYRPDLRIVPTASVIVVGDGKQVALNVANTLAKRYPDKTIYAVRGGVTAWEFVRKALEKVTASSAGAPGAISFVIPHNTCETGTPLQVLSSGGKAKSKP